MYHKQFNILLKNHNAKYFKSTFVYEFNSDLHNKKYKS